MTTRDPHHMVIIHGDGRVEMRTATPFSHVLILTKTDPKTGQPRDAIFESHVACAPTDDCAAEDREWTAVYVERGWR